MAGLQGRTLGGYQLTEQIASAGIAEVYRARPLAANGREVVIKVIYPEFARYPSFLPNFQHIIQTAARLASHPHILPVVASGEENGYLYLATPWVAMAPCATGSRAADASVSATRRPSSINSGARWLMRTALAWYTAI